MIVTLNGMITYERNIFQMVMETPDAVILDLGFGTGTIMNGRERTSWIE